MSRFALTLLLPSVLFLPMNAMAQNTPAQQQMSPAVQQQGAGASTALNPEKRAILQQFGAFTQSDKYGEVWSPTVTPPNWHPYMACNWVNTKQYGWFYKDNTPWGNIVHHYGRWAFDAQKGWLWIPGAEFSPGWVEWRTSPEWIGWAPIPPESDIPVTQSEAFNNAGFWTFVETPKFNSGCSGVAVAPDQIPVLLQNTQFVTRVVNRGGIAVYVMPAYVSGAFVDISVDFVPWPDIFYQQYLLMLSGIWNHTDVVIHKRYVDCGKPAKCPPNQGWDPVAKVCSEAFGPHKAEPLSQHKSPPANNPPGTNNGGGTTPNNSYSPKPSHSYEPIPAPPPNIIVPPTLVPAPGPQVTPPRVTGDSYCPPNARRIGNDCISLQPQSCPPGQIRNPEGFCAYPPINQPYPPGPKKCPEGQHKDANGDCTVANEAPQPKKCENGFHLDANGNCTTAPDNVGKRPPQGDCTPGLHRDVTGQCVSTPGNNGTHPSTKPDSCPSGQHKDGNGDCTVGDTSKPKGCDFGFHLDASGKCTTMPDNTNKNHNDEHHENCAAGTRRGPHNTCIPLGGPIDKIQDMKSPPHAGSNNGDGRPPLRFPPKNSDSGVGGSNKYMPNRTGTSYPQVKTCPNGVVVRFGARCPAAPNYQYIPRPAPNRPSQTKPNVNNLNGGGLYNPSKYRDYRPVKIPQTLMNTHPSTGQSTTSGSHNNNYQNIRRWAPNNSYRTYQQPQ